MSQRWKDRKTKIGAFSRQEDDEERKNAWPRGAVPTRGGSGLGREGGVRTTAHKQDQREEKKNGDPELRSPLGPRSPAWSNFAKEESPGDTSRGAPTPPPGGSSSGTSGVIPLPGEDWAGSVPRVVESGPADRQVATLWGRKGLGGARNLSPPQPCAALGRGRRSAARRSSLALRGQPRTLVRGNPARTRPRRGPPGTRRARAPRPHAPPPTPI